MIRKWIKNTFSDNFFLENILFELKFAVYLQHKIKVKR